jgi:hypothetical protein
MVTMTAWNTVYLNKALHTLQSQGMPITPERLEHLRSLRSGADIALAEAPEEKERYATSGAPPRYGRPLLGTMFLEVYSLTSCGFVQTNRQRKNRGKVQRMAFPSRKTRLNL